MMVHDEVPEGYSWHTAAAPDGRSIEVLAAGPEDGKPLLFHAGTPSGAAPFPMLVDAAAAGGLRTVSYSRPGYGASTEAPGRTVADAAGDSVAVLEALGYGEAGFVTIGWSGGGPHALACAALLGDRCAAAGVIAGVAPRRDDFDWTAGMGESNIEEFGQAMKGESALAAWLEQAATMMALVTEPAIVADGLADLIVAADRETLLSTSIGQYLVDALHQALAGGVAGWRDDDLAFVGDWGYDVSTVAGPVIIWHGTDDLMVPAAHGEWLAANVPDAWLERRTGEGHISVVPSAIAGLVAELASGLA